MPIVYRTPPYPWHIEPPTNGISTPQPMVYQIPCPWYFEPPTHGTWNPLLMVFRSHNYPWYIELHTHGISNPLSWYIEPPTHDILTLTMLYRTSCLSHD